MFNNRIPPSLALVQDSRGLGMSNRFLVKYAMSRDVHTSVAELQCVNAMVANRER